MNRTSPALPRLRANSVTLSASICFTSGRSSALPPHDQPWYSFDFGPIGGDVAGLPGLRSALSSELDLSNLNNRRDTMDMSSVARELPSLRRSKSDSALLDTAARSTAQESSEAAGGERAASCAGSSDDEASFSAADVSCRFESPAPLASSSSRWIQSLGFSLAGTSA